MGASSRYLPYVSMMSQANFASQLGRHVKLFTKKIPELDLTDMASAEKLERVWKQWARYEEMKR